MKMWIRNTDGRKDAILTMAIVGFAFVLVKFVLSGVVFTLSDGKMFEFGTIDGGSIGAILTPTLGAYVARRYTDRKYKVPSTDEGKE